MTVLPEFEKLLAHRFQAVAYFTATVNGAAIKRDDGTGGETFVADQQVKLG